MSGTQRRNQIGKRRRRPFLSLRTRRASWSTRKGIVVAGITVSALSGLVYCGLVLHRRLEPTFEAAAVLEPGDVRFKADDFPAGRARYYRYAAGPGREVRLVIARTPDGKWHSAFDACEACYRERRGYRQVESGMVCNACGKAFPMAHVGVDHGNCNPVPLAGEAQGNDLLLRAAAIESGNRLF